MTKQTAANVRHISPTDANATGKKTSRAKRMGKVKTYSHAITTDVSEQQSIMFVSTHIRIYEKKQKLEITYRETIK